LLLDSQNGQGAVDVTGLIKDNMAEILQLKMENSQLSHQVVEVM